MEPRIPSRASEHAPAAPRGPVRTCVGCRGRESRSVLVRVVLSGGVAVIDESRALPGRGAWLHPDPDCIARALNRRAIERALRAPVADVTALEGIARTHANRTG